MSDELAELLWRVGGADPQAADELFTLLYDELRRLAERQLRAGDGLTLSTTTLVHETYLSMTSRSQSTFPDRARFFAYASRAMRGLVIDYARHRRAKKRDRGFEITLSEDDSGSPDPGTATPAEELDALSGALGRLAALDPALAELVDLHFFASPPATRSSRA